MKWALLFSALPNLCACWNSCWPIKFPLADDRRYFPPYHAVPVMLTRTLERYPQLRPALDKLANAISDETMRRMNYAAEVEQREPADIVREFLLKK